MRLEGGGFGVVSGAGLAQACVEGIVAMCPANAVRHLHIAVHGEAPVLQLLSAKSHASLTIPHSFGVGCGADEGQGRLCKHRQVARQGITCQEQCLQLGRDLPAAGGVVCSALSSVDVQYDLHSRSSLEVGRQQSTKCVVREVQRVQLCACLQSQAEWCRSSAPNWCPRCSAG